MISWALGIHEVTPEFREEGQSSIKKAQTRRKYRNARNKEVLGRYTHATMKWRAKRLSNTNATHNLRQSTTHADTNDRMRFRARAHKRVARCLAAGRSSRMGEPAMMEGGRGRPDRNRHSFGKEHRCSGSRWTGPILGWQVDRTFYLVWAERVGDGGSEMGFFRGRRGIEIRKGRKATCRSNWCHFCVATKQNILDGSRD